MNIAASINADLALGSRHDLVRQNAAFVFQFVTDIHRAVAPGISP
jgi:hypothetical protein